MIAGSCATLDRIRPLPFQLSLRCDTHCPLPGVSRAFNASRCFEIFGQWHICALPLPDIFALTRCTDDPDLRAPRSAAVLYRLAERSYCGVWSKQVEDRRSNRSRHDAAAQQVLTWRTDANARDTAQNMQLHRCALDDGLCECRLLWRDSRNPYTAIVALGPMARRGWSAAPAPTFQHGLLRIGELPIWEAMQQRRFSTRHTAGSWVAQPTLPPTEADFERIVPEHREILRQIYEQESREPTTVSCFVPKPLGLAILIAVAGFPRRGDIYKSEANRYAADIFTASTQLIELAEQRVASYALPALLQRAEDTLKDRALPFELRRVIAAEYTVKWADQECEFYTHVARLAALEYFGVAGSSMDNLTPEMQLPQLRHAKLPDISEFLTFTENADN